MHDIQDRQDVLPFRTFIHSFWIACHVNSGPLDDLDAGIGHMVALLSRQRECRTTALRLACAMKRRLMLSLPLLAACTPGTDNFSTTQSISVTENLPQGFAPWNDAPVPYRFGGGDRVELLQHERPRDL